MSAFPPTNLQDDELNTDGSTTDFTEFTPATESTMPTDSWDGHIREIPWPGKTLMILEHSTGRAIALSEDGTLVLRSVRASSPSNCHWLCVERNDFFGFIHPQTGKYMGYDKNWGLSATASCHSMWESLVIRKHPEGGYQMLAPTGPGWSGPSLRIVCVAEDGLHLTFRQHGATVWDFVRV